jgi:hypothetical protein
MHARCKRLHRLYVHLRFDGLGQPSVNVLQPTSRKETEDYIGRFG